MKKLQELKKFVNHIEKLNEKLSDQYMDYVEGKTKDIEKFDITITLNNQTLKIPFSADSYEPLLELVNQEIEYLEEN